ncbi:MAG: hypothetical protein LBI53_02475 [Candidatus Peribacteria bacterium]|jgi:PBP1b-binding outer membrane lipoprotein LpoB|nr:hypothetical protein [Candidatus Peribacteria bacterium]
MKKLRLVPIILGSTLLLTACGNKQNDAQQSTTNNNALPVTQTAMDCAEAIPNHLSNADFQ